MGKKKQKAMKEALRREMAAAGVTRLPKTECCVSKDRCGRCPIRMLKEGTLPTGFTVRKRKLVKIDTPVCAPATTATASGDSVKKSKKKSKKKQPLAA